MSQILANFKTANEFYYFILLSFFLKLLCKLQLATTSHFICIKPGTHWRQSQLLPKPATAKLATKRVKARL